MTIRIKQLFLIVSLLNFCLVPVTHASLFGFMDGKYYDESQALKYICFMDNNCLDANGGIVHRDTWQEVDPVPQVNLGSPIPTPTPTGPFYQYPGNTITSEFKPDAANTPDCPSDLSHRYPRYIPGAIYYDVPGYRIIKFANNDVCKLQN